LQNCPSFNKYNTYDFYQDKVYLMDNFDTSNKFKAYEKSFEWGDKIPIGIFYEEQVKPFHELFLSMNYKSPLEEKIKVESIKKYLKAYQ